MPPAPNRALNPSFEAHEFCLAQLSAFVTPTGKSGLPCMDRRSVLTTSFSVASLPLFLASPAFASEKGYLTLSEYQALIRQEKADEKAYGQFEALRVRASQTTEFDALAANDDFAGISKLALAWDSSIRKEVLEQAS